MKVLWGVVVFDERVSNAGGDRALAMLFALLLFWGVLKMCASRNSSWRRGDAAA